VRGDCGDRLCPGASGQDNSERVWINYRRSASRRGSFSDEVAVSAAIAATMNSSILSAMLAPLGQCSRADPGQDVQVYVGRVQLAF